MRAAKSLARTVLLVGGGAPDRYDMSVDVMAFVHGMSGCGRTAKRVTPQGIQRSLRAAGR
jgi:hypothetical protein